MLYCPNFFWNVLQVWMTGKDVYLQMTWSWPDKTWNILCSYCLQWNTSQNKFRNHYFLFLFAFSILSQLFRIWGCNMVVITARKGWPDTATLASGQIHSTQGQRVESSWSRWSHWMDLEGLRRPVGRAIYHYFQPLAITVCCLHLLQVSDDHPSSKENHSELPEWLSSSCSNPYQHQMFWETHTLTSKLSSLPTSIKTILLTEQTDRQKMQSSKLSTLHLHMWMTETLM